VNTSAVVYLTNRLAYQVIGGKRVCERFINNLQEVRGIDRITVVQRCKAPIDSSTWTDMGIGCVIRDMAEQPPILTDDNCIDAYTYACDGEGFAPHRLLAAVPYMLFLPAAKMELCLRGLRDALWAGPSRQTTVVLTRKHGGLQRVQRDGYIGGIRVMQAILVKDVACTTKRPAEMWDTSFTGVDVDAYESLNIVEPAAFRLAEASLIY
jgi:hypothetical protein